MSASENLIETEAYINSPDTTSQKSTTHSLRIYSFIVYLAKVDFC